MVDSNYQHALAWYRAFRRFDITLPLRQLHRGIGMGGDKYVAHVAGDDVQREHGDALRDAWIGEFDRLIGEIRPFAATAPLLKAVKQRGFRVVLASSGKSEHVETFLDPSVAAGPRGPSDDLGGREVYESLDDLLADLDNTR